MSESTLPSSDPGAQKRRSTRIVQAVPITVSGVDALGQPFKERTTTVTVNCHGCKYQSKHYVPKNSIVTIEVPRTEPGAAARTVTGHVVWVQRPRTVRELFQIGLEFEAAGNVWGIAFPPEDWVGTTDQEAEESIPADIEVIVETDTPPATAAHRLGPVSPPAGATPPSATEASSPAAPPGATTSVAGQSAPTAAPKAGPVPPPASVPASPAAGDTKIHVMPSPAVAGQDAQLLIARQMARIVAEAKETLDKTLRREAQAAINEEMTVVRQQLDAQMHDTVEHAIKSSLERVSEAEVKKVVLQATNQTAAIVEQARLASLSATQTNVEQVDAKVRDAVQQAVSQATAQAATQLATIVEEARLASQTASHANLHQSEHSFDARIGEAVQQAVSQATAQAATHTTAAVEQVRLLSQIATRETIDRIDAKIREAVQSAVGEVTAQSSTQTAARAEEARKAAMEAAEEAAEIAAERAAIRASALVEEARKANEAHERLIEERVRQSVHDAAALAAKEAVRQSVDLDLRRIVDEAVGRVFAEQQASAPSFQAFRSPEAVQQQLDEWRRRLEETAQVVLSRTLTQTEGEAETAKQRWNEDLEAALAGSSRKLDEQIGEVVRAAIARAENDFAGRNFSLRAQMDDAVSAAGSAIASLETQIAEQRERAEEARAHLQRAAQSAIDQARQEVDDIAAAQRHAIGRQADEVIAERVQNLEPGLLDSAQRVLGNFSAELNQKLAPKMDEIQRAVSDIGDATRRGAELQSNLQWEIQKAAQQAAQIQDSLHERIEQASDEAIQRAISDLTAIQHRAAEAEQNIRREIQQAADQAVHIQNSIQEKVQAASETAVKNAVGELAFAGQEAIRLQESVREEIRRASEQVGSLGNSALQQVQSASSEAAQRLTSEIESATYLVAQLENSLRDQMAQSSFQLAEVENRIRGEAQRASEQVNSLGALALERVQSASSEAAEMETSIRSHLQQASEEAAEIQRASRESMRQASEQTVYEAIERMKQETARFPSELEQSCRVTINKLEEELDQKSSEMQHSAYEALLKSSEWYQKKAQTSMHSTMERLVEQSGNSMHDKAAEVSSRVAAELDHYRRSYVDHSRAEIEEAAKEVTDRERLRLSETAEIAHAGFTDRVQHLTHDALQRFQETSRQALEKARSDMEFNREGSLEKFQKLLDEQMTRGVEQASTYLQSELMPLLESWEAKREAEKKEWVLQLQHASEESIAAYKARLENATNAWLLASAATLGQNSQAVLDNLSRAAEKRMRDTCSRVLAGMGDLLKERLTGISTAFLAEDELKDK